MRVHRLGRLVEYSCDQFRSPLREHALSVMEDTVDDATIGHLLWIRRNGIRVARNRPGTLLMSVSEHIAYCLSIGSRWFVLLVVVDEGATGEVLSQNRAGRTSSRGVGR